MKNSIFTVLLIILCLTACEKKQKFVVPTEQQLLVKAIRAKNFTLVNSYLEKIRLTENSQNLIQLYMSLYSDNLLTLAHSVSYLEQFYSEMSHVEQSAFNQMAQWVYISTVYRQEVSPPVRILQRQTLLLAPSDIDFSWCEDEAINKHCAHQQRKKLSIFMSTKQLTQTLKKMALKDPCVNLSSKPLRQTIANRCLKKSTGDLKVSLLPVPFFSYNEWLQIVNNK